MISRAPLVPGLMIAASSMILAGCATVSPQSARNDVRREVGERLGSTVVWNSGSDADEAVEQRIDTLLAQELSPDSAIQIALLHNRRIQAYYEDLAIAQADLVAAGLLKNPVFDGALQFADDGHLIELNVVQDFLDVFYLPLRRRIAADAFEAAKLRVTAQVLALAGEVRTSFIDFVSAEQTLELRRQVLQATEAAYDIARRLREAGNISELAFANERALYEEARLSLHAAEIDVVERRENINALLGLWGKRVTWKAAPRLPAVPAEEEFADDIEGRAIERSLALAAQRFDLSRTATRAGVARWKDALPEFEAGVAAEHEPDGEWSVGPSVAFPLPIFHQGQAARARAHAEFRRAAEVYTATAAELRARVRSTFARVTAARERVAYLQEVLLPLREQVVTQAQLQYNAMQIGPVTLLQAKQQQIQTGADTIRAIRDYWVARARLDQLLNGSIPAREDGDSASQDLNSSATARPNDH